MTTKKQTTRKATVNRFEHVLQVGYCELPNLLYFEDADSYTAGVYGWNSDIYQVGFDTCICTGYRPFGDIKVDRDLCKLYDTEAYRLIKTCPHHDLLPYFLRELQTEFVRVAISRSEQAC